MVMILDTTLREGEQTPGVCFNTHIKTAIAGLLNRVGVDIIETGHPLVTQEIKRAVTEIAHRGFKARVGAHARSVLLDADLALDCGVKFLGLFYCMSEERLSMHQVSLTNAIDQVVKVISHCRERSKDLMIRYTPEDTVRSSWKNVICAAKEAVRAGADIISVADTTGYMIPGTSRSMYDYVTRLKTELAQLDLHPMVAVHCHNDRGLALANALDGYRAGAEVIDASVMGLGERAGVTDLASLLAILKTDFDAPNSWDLYSLTKLYELVSRYSKYGIPHNLPITGEHVFTHCAGVHTQAALKNPLHYQSLAPETFGRESCIALDHMSGLSAINHCLKQIGKDDALSNEVLTKVKEIGQMGRVVDLQELRFIVDHLKQDHDQNRSAIGEFK